MSYSSFTISNCDPEPCDPMDLDLMISGCAHPTFRTSFESSSGESDSCLSSATKLRGLARRGFRMDDGVAGASMPCIPLGDTRWKSNPWSPASLSLTFEV
ncbi:hypothetical protein M427DRAFT_362294 [Gonapodya prolifera JEL478]|uniref:Uncharacterized protein n=1 Tax=Gonapodya prolifera (strain JEL478) TaxID=1344416 RepID=A0A139AA54_GONPJ|nr:hypothetical protein M427DRAFT_362294 [Gonapodya prolifera JEL478]|eukprot:KXS13691.1 hypothetical protein M427DRAFT_362294 [Gonapodya prolifera JEL478]